jgi:two-component system response regulator MtrA
MPSILVVDDDPAIAEMISIVLTGAGYETYMVLSGDQAIDAFETQKPDLVLLDVMLPGKDGIEVCREIREKSLIPIVMLTAKTDITDVVVGLEAGADDYMMKPFTEMELLARIKARLRRSPNLGTQTLKIGEIEIDLTGHKVKKNNKEIPLTRLEFDLLGALFKEPTRVFTREDLLSEVWGYRPATDTRLVNVHVQRLRAKIEDDQENPKYVLTVRGIGYRAGINGQ